MSDHSSCSQGPRFDSLEEAFKADRALAVENIKVTVGDKTFDGDEVSQTHMVQAAIVMTDEETTKWVLANNDDVMVTKAELLEALRLAGAERTKIWVMP